MSERFSSISPVIFYYIHPMYESIGGKIHYDNEKHEGRG